MTEIFTPWFISNGVYVYGCFHEVCGLNLIVFDNLPYFVPQRWLWNVIMVIMKVQQISLLWQHYKKTSVLWLQKYDWGWLATIRSHIFGGQLFEKKYDYKYDC